MSMLPPAKRLRSSAHSSSGRSSKTSGGQQKSYKLPRRRDRDRIERLDTPTAQSGPRRNGSMHLERSPGTHSQTTASTSNPRQNNHTGLEGLKQFDRSDTGPQRFFSNSHHLVFNHPVMNSINEVKEQVLPWLARSTMSGAEFDSSIRDPPPHCHPGTRVTILETVCHWIRDTKHTTRLLWLNGSAGVGKSAIVQTLAEELSSSSELGATLFFSRSNKCDKPSLVFPTIAYQLAVRIPPYKDYLRQRMIDDPRLLEKSMIHQFNFLIVEPFASPGLGLGGSQFPWTILLDGLDECDGEEAQVLIVKLISRFSAQHPAAPLVWVIASRPEAHLSVAFKSGDVTDAHWTFTVPTNTDEACRDVEHFLRAKFEEVRQKYKDLIPGSQPWPMERDLVRIFKAASGLFIFASTLIRFVSDPHICDPISQLATILSLAQGVQMDPLLTLRIFYTRILDNVPKSVLPILKLLLGWTMMGTSFILDGDDSDYRDDLPLVVSASILGLQQHTVYAALRRLHSVIKVPPLEESGLRDIRFYHASFADYLCDPSKSGDYVIDFDYLRTKVWWCYFAMLPEDTSYTVPRPQINLAWDLGNYSTDTLLDHLWDWAIFWLIHYLMPRCCFNQLYPQHDHEQVSLTTTELLSAFEKIDFSRLLFRCRYVDPFINLLSFSEWLMYDAPPSLIQSGLVRVVPVEDLDFTCISENKIAVEVGWACNETLKAQAASGTDPEKFWFVGYTNAPLESFHKSWRKYIAPTKELLPKLNRLRGETPTIHALIVGKGSRSGAFIYNKTNSLETGTWYYLPYC